MSDNYYRCFKCQRLFKSRIYGIPEYYCPKCQYLRDQEVKETNRICKEFFNKEAKEDKL